jgi:Uma2 family endonuclease
MRFEERFKTYPSDLAMSGPRHDSAVDEPAWEVAHLFPFQGQWSECDYLALNTNHLVELSDGKLEVLPMPTELHQEIVLFLYEALLLFTRPANLGKALVAPLRVRLWEGKFREPDVVFLLTGNRGRRGSKYWSGADLVMEVVSDDDPDRDLVEKRAEYARARIPEYWIVDPRDRSVTVLTLDSAAGEYVEASRTHEGEVARSVLLDGFSVAVTEVFLRS